MSDQALDIFKFVLLGMIYLFFVRVLWAVWSEVRTPRTRVVHTSAPRPTPQPTVAPDPTAAMGRDTAETARRATTPAGRVPKGRGGRAGRIVVLEPRHRRGIAVALDGEVTLGRDDAATISITDDEYVSHLHLRLWEHDGQPMVEDLGSTNGTFHNGNRLHGAKPLRPGDRIQVGTTVMEAQ
ncbi:MAG: FHA domain-containing protein [Actinomycetota bacterium]